MKPVAFKEFTLEEHETWGLLFSRQSLKRDRQIHPVFARGLKALEMGPGRIPSLDAINARLERMTGFRGVPVEGLEEHCSFFRLLAQRRFPIGNFIRDRSDLSYTPAPDVFHDLYGHVPFLADERYAGFCAAFGELASGLCEIPGAVEKLARYFWFTIEFGLVETPEGRRIFGAGIASSIQECDYALSREPEVRPFSVGAVCAQDFKIDELQRVLFVLQGPEQLYGSLGELEKAVRLA